MNKQSIDNTVITKYFSKNFTPDCITKIDEKIFLSLEKANLFVLEKIGIPKKNIVSFSECTCCTKIENENNSHSNQENFKYVRWIWI